jgi:GT2 family glycosyltransferase
VTEIIKELRPDTIYGNEWKYSYDGMEDGLPAVVDSAYLLIPRKVWDAVGKFDPQMDAAFEEVDYCIRAIDKGYRLDVVNLPITHLNLHTRRELEGYDQRWEATRRYFHHKHPNREGVSNGS